MLVYQSQLNRQNLVRLFKFLNYKQKNDECKSPGIGSENAMSLIQMEKAYRPHIFRLKLKHGNEKIELCKLMSELKS